VFQASRLHHGQPDQQTSADSRTIHLWIRLSFLAVVRCVEVVYTFIRVLSCDEHPRFAAAVMASPTATASAMATLRPHIPGLAAWAAGSVVGRCRFEMKVPTLIPVVERFQRLKILSISTCAATPRASCCSRATTKSRTGSWTTSQSGSTRSQLFSKSWFYPPSRTWRGIARASAAGASCLLIVYRCIRIHAPHAPLCAQTASCLDAHNTACTITHPPLLLLSFTDAASVSRATKPSQLWPRTSR